MSSKKPFNIYFAGSIRWSKIGCDLYADIVDHLKTHGIVLTEHVAHAFKNPEKYNIAFTVTDIFSADNEFLEKADVMIAEVSAPSHGVGRELCYAQHVKKIPILALHLPEVNVSAMVSGNPYIILAPYATLEEGKNQVDAFFSTLAA